MRPCSNVALWMSLVLVGACANKSCGSKETPAERAPRVPRSAADPALPGLGPGDQKLMARLAKALREKGPAYTPRTHHKKVDGTPKYTNRLILENSPYLLQHAHNPVNWYPWGPEAFARAQREGKPVLVSIGYSTCHWCHVMERESFEDLEIARTINQHFVAIKVDREERPDLDNLYMKAVTMLTGRGGWPMTVVMTPDKKPFFGGTYFPARDGNRGARKGFLSILRELSSEYSKDRSDLVLRAQQLSQQIQAAAAPSPRGDVPGASAIERAVDQARSSFDAHWGGFGRAPKFPRPALLELLLRYQRRTGDVQALDMVTVTLEHMAIGGIYDQVGGGFHRYSTDGHWLVPHFEKMLYDNAQLVPIYLEAYQVTGRERFREVATDTLRYVAREMTSPEGAFFSATDADSPAPSGQQREGYFFTWTPREIEQLLGSERSRPVVAYYGVTERGNFGSRNILSTPRSYAEVASELHMTAPALEQAVAAGRQRLYAARSRRPAPLRDDKVVTSWNGLMVSAFARAALVLDDPEFAEYARRAADFALKKLRTDDGRLLRSCKDGRAEQEGFLDDYAFFVQGLLDLFEATSEGRWLRQAIALQGALDRHFWDGEAGGYFMTSDAHEALLARDKPTYDGAEPSGNSVALMNLLRLATVTTRPEYRERAQNGLAAFSQHLVSAPDASPKMLCALEYSLDQPLEVFVVKRAPEANPGPLVSRFRRTYLPNRVFALVTEGEDLDRLARLVPLIEGKSAVRGEVTAFVCQRGVCQLPTSDPAAFERQLGKVQRFQRSGMAK